MSAPASIIADDFVPLARPHFELRGRRLYFLISRRPFAELDAKDAALWTRIDGRVTVAELQAEMRDARERLLRFREIGVCELVPGRFPIGRRRVLVIEPHMDDAILSVGGTMWARRAACEFTVVTIAGRSNYTSYHDLGRNYFDVERVSALRRAESSVAMRMVGGNHASLDEVEAPLRLQPGNWSLDWQRRHRKLVDAFIMHRSPPRETELWSAAIERVVRDSDAREVWLPLGVGSHTDHELARDACLRALERLPGLERRVTLKFYQEVPYANQFPEHPAAIVGAMTEGGGVLSLDLVDISGAIAHKQRLASVFGSQFKLSYMAPRIEAAARRGGTGLTEVFYTVEQLPTRVDSIAAYSGSRAVREVIARALPWHRRHRLAPRIRVLSPVPVARWADDLACLLDAFRHASFEIYVSEEYADETERLVSPRIEVRVVHGREGAWIAQMARLFVTRPVPTVFLTGEGLREWSWLARGVFASWDPLMATRMNDLVLALQRPSP